MDKRLAALFAPRSVALVGASRDPGSMSGVLLRNLRSSFRGSIYPVNPRAESIDGLPAYPSLAEVPSPVDLIFLAVPPAAVLENARAGIACGARALVVISAGFSETDDRGRALERELLELAREAGIPLLGPNCLGLLETNPDRPLNGSFILREPPAGAVAVGTQSGAFGFVFPEYMRTWQLGVSQMVSLGNKLDVGENDLLEYWETDDRTRVIQLYLESFQDPRAFLEIARRVGRTKPLIVLKAGGTSAGARAAGSHTAALATPAAETEGLLAQAGVIRAQSLEELFDTTALLAMQPLPPGRRVGILTNAGGPGVLYADALEAAGLTVPAFSDALQRELRTLMPPQASAANPIDLIGSTDPEQFRGCAQRLLASEEIDAVTLLYVPRLPGTTPEVARAFVEVAAEAASDKTLTAVLMETDEPPAVLREAKPAIPSFRFPEGAARALAHAADYAERRREALGSIPQFSDIDAAAVRRVMDAAIAQCGPDGWLAAADAIRLLDVAGCRVPEWSEVTTAEAAVAAAEGIGYPVVLKLVAPEVVHKTDVGGVVLGLTDADAVRSAFEKLTQVTAPTAVLVQSQVPAGREVLVGLVHRPEFGHLVTCGPGGTLVETFGTPPFRLCPLTDRDARELVEASGVAKLLMTRRREAGRPQEAVEEVVLRLSRLVELAPEIREADVNPLIIAESGGEALAVDVRVRVEFGS